MSVTTCELCGVEIQMVDEGPTVWHHFSSRFRIPMYYCTAVQPDDSHDLIRYHQPVPLPEVPDLTDVGEVTRWLTG